MEVGAEAGGSESSYHTNLHPYTHARRYNDRAPLENHHLAAAFTLLRRPEYAFLSHLPKADTDRMRKMVGGGGGRGGDRARKVWGETI